MENLHSLGDGYVLSLIDRSGKTVCTFKTNGASDVEECEGSTVRFVETLILIENTNFFAGSDKVVFQGKLHGLNSVNVKLHFVWVHKGPF